jgi:hypothetical protein
VSIRDKEEFTELFLTRFKEDNRTVYVVSVADELSYLSNQLSCTKEFNIFAWLLSMMM